MERTRLELLFDQELLQNAEQARILCGSPVTRFVRSVQTTGGVSAVPGALQAEPSVRRVRFACTGRPTRPVRGGQRRQGQIQARSLPTTKSRLSCSALEAGNFKSGR